MILSFTVNGKPVTLEASPQRRLLDILRDDLELIGTKEGCGKGECGACTVILNGERVNSCLVPALQLEGSRVTTIEGIEKWKSYHVLKRAFIENGAVQCGFCTPGFVVSMTAFLRETKPPYDLETIKWNMSGNICRCTGYEKILNVVQDISSKPSKYHELKETCQQEPCDE